MTTRRMAVVGGLAVVLSFGSLAGVSGGASAGPSGDAAGRAQRVTHLLGSRRAVSADELKWRPGSASRDVRVIVRLAADPAAVVAGRAAERGARLSPSAVRAAAVTATASQERALVAARRLGAKVSTRYSAAINGFAATVPASRLAALRAAPGVAAVTPVREVHRTNLNSDAFVGAITAWTAYGRTGRGQTIAIIDTGVDYTHAAFGGPGRPAAFTNNDGAVIEPGSFPTAKVIGGYDFVGDDYDFGEEPQPDPDPLDCDGHGTHVAGTAAGFGVTAAGRTFRGPYTQANVDATSFEVGPGSAPGAKLLAYRVFGCEGSTSTENVVAAIDRSVADGADVVNLSLGSNYGRADDADAVAADNAMLAGTMVVSAAGNEGPRPYIMGGTGLSRRGLTVAAMDAVATFPGATFDPPGAAVAAINANDGPLPVRARVHVVRDGDGEVSLGCSADDFDDGTAGAIAVVARGVCARVDKALLGEDAGAVAVIMINNSDGLPPFEGDVPGLAIPFIGVAGGDADAVTGRDGATVTVAAAGLIPNPGHPYAASFTTGGPRPGDGGHKPDVSAPGVSIVSAGVGLGTGSVSSSGTSMATPVTAGLAALVRQAHPRRSPFFVKAALINTARRNLLDGFDTRISGNGVVWAPAAIRTQQAMTSGRGQDAVNFSIRETTTALDLSQGIRLHNFDAVARSYRLSAAWVGESLGAEVTITPSLVQVPAGGGVDATVRIRMSRAALKALPRDLFGDIAAVRGQVIATPRAGGTRLSMPLLMVPHARSEVTTSVVGPRRVSVRNTGLVPGGVDAFSWLLRDGRNAGSRVDARAFGVQYFDSEDFPGDKVVSVAFSTFTRQSNGGEGIYEVLVDTRGDSDWEYDVFIADDGLVFEGAANGYLDLFVLDPDGNGVVYEAVGPADGSVVAGAFLASDIGLSPARPQAKLEGGTLAWASDNAVFDAFDGVATLNPWAPQTSQGDSVVLRPGAGAILVVSARPPRPGERRALGWMLVNVDDRSGAAQADLVARP